MGVSVVFEHYLKHSPILYRAILFDLRQRKIRIASWRGWQSDELVSVVSQVSAYSITPLPSAALESSPHPTTNAGLPSPFQLFFVSLGREVSVCGRVSGLGCSCGPAAVTYLHGIR